MNIVPEDVLCFCDPVAIERIDDDHAVFLTELRELIVVNEMGAAALVMIDGTTSVATIVERLAAQSSSSVETIWEDTMVFFSDWVRKGYLIRRPVKADETTGILYIANPAVITEEKDEEGVVLFNGDTRRRIELNATAAVMWQSVRIPRTMAGILAYFCTRVDADIENADIGDDIREFIDMMVENGYIGRVLEGEKQ
ncbi:PqqD family protein [bacterium]|nr:PqqD family protein [candidate division CSSED10-310 bacterium]